MSLRLTREDINTTQRAAAAALEVNGMDYYLFGGAACMYYGNTRIPNDIDVVVATHRGVEEIKRSIALIDSKECKVDILKPGILDIPETSYVVSTTGVHLMPPTPLLLMKLKGWEDHRLSRRIDFRAKVPTDASDIVELLAIIQGSQYRTTITSNEDGLSYTFLRRSKDRVRDFVLSYPSTRNRWQVLGFDV
ncbi:hypothetical protein FISHEDRAFT_68833 [Fistulina hepatica ATCC 64428]|uniref:Nucleotidyltransferase n=1 Tax=Fistulina hepatica ATCC 64428 TaxID=1128425 RepID=A0A0D7ARP1_9AGAR|nr:hypothetical protein FISHEDRAFT_68833 [Fistulina hepatica ATCC 64428]